jgi:CHASE1-domain containing sensor protein/two-component sensor histidine kinase
MKSVKFIKHYFLPFACFFFVFLVTFYAYFEFRDRALERSRKLFNIRTSQAKNAIKTRLTDYIQILKGAQGLFAVSDTVTRALWKTYVQSLEVDKNYPGFQGLGYVAYLYPDEVEKLSQKIRDEGFSDFSVFPQGKREMYSPVIYIEPLKERNLRALGFDMFSHPVRREAMVRAMEENKPAISGKVTLIQETDEGIQHGFLLYLPVYMAEKDPLTVEERAKLIKGFVYSPFRAQDMMNSILQYEFTDIDIEIYDGVAFKQDDLIYNKDTIINYFDSKSKNEFTNLTRLRIAGHTWTIYLRSLPGFGIASDRSQPLFILLAGSIISLLVFFVTMSFANIKRTNESVRKKNEELIKINNDLDNFVYTASHDLKAPISNIEGLVTLLREELSEEVVRNKNIGSVIDMIKKSIGRFKSTIQDLTDIAKINKNIYEDTSLINVKEMVEDVMMSISDLIQNSGSVINIHTEASPFIRFSKTNFKSIVYNLLSNAIKYHSPHRNPEIFISTYKLKDYTLIEVKDNGLGISKENREKVFTMFKRLHDHVEGSGVGLYIVKRIVKNAGGKVEVESELGKGSTFKVYLKQE